MDYVQEIFKWEYWERIVVLSIFGILALIGLIIFIIAWFKN